MKKFLLTMMGILIPLFGLSQVPHAASLVDLTSHKENQITTQQQIAAEQNEINQALATSKMFDKSQNTGTSVGNPNPLLVEFTPTPGATETFTPAVGDFFYDTGGPGGGGLNPGGENGTELPGNYKNCGCITTTTLSGVSEIEFHVLDLFGTFDQLKIYDGTDASGTLIYDSNTNANTDTLAGMIALNGSGVFTAASGSFTFVFNASTVVDHTGWEVEIMATDGSGGTGSTPCTQTFTGAPNTAVSIINNGSADYRGANDFHVNANETFTLEKITIDFLGDNLNPYTPTTATVYLHEDNPAGGIGAEMDVISGVAVNAIPNGTLAGYPRYTIEITLPTPYLFDGGTAGTDYWVGLGMNAPPTSGIAFWVSSLYTSNGTDVMYQTLDGGATWAIIYDAGTQSQTLEGVMLLTGQCETGGATGGPDCGQGNDSPPGFGPSAVQIGSGTTFRNADDFFVSAGETLNIKTIEMNTVLALGSVESIGFTIYNDNGGSPGTTIVDQVTGLVPYEQVYLAPYGIYNIYKIYVDVDLNFTGGAAGTSYWIQPTAVAPGGATGGVFWEGTPTGTIGEPIHGSVSNGPWTPNVDGLDAVFKLYCEHIDPPPAPCNPATQDASFEYIQNVTFAGIDNTTGGDAGPPNDYTSQVANVTAGTSVPISVTIDSDSSEYVSVFIDWDQNGTLNDPGEEYILGVDVGGFITLTGNIAVPANALPGNTLMRVMLQYDAAPNPCVPYFYGEIEDYTVNVTDGNPPPGGACNQDFNGAFSLASSIIDNPTLGLYRAVANDFFVPANTETTMNSIKVLLVQQQNFQNYTTFDVSILDSNANTPGSEIHSLPGLTPTSIVQGPLTFGGFPTFYVTLDLGSYVLPTESTDTRYWIAVTGRSANNTNIFWAGYQYVAGSPTTNNYVSNEGNPYIPITSTDVPGLFESIWTLDATCEVMAVNDVVSSGLTYYPNPVKDVLNITSKQKVENVEVFNVAGQKVMTVSKVTNGQINVSRLAAGVYIVTAKLANGQVESFKVIKE
ncbi:MAG: T9SS type A sorting domain-containing protein [Flavobacteriaceae bacterium]|jgi:hypothetical protein|nr:T9SS type A sorting domain-containing protein [Flavobacteriaceae bacterium]